MKIILYVKKEDLVKLANFLTSGEILDICWSERMFMDFVQVSLDYTDYIKLLDISDKIENEPEVESDVEEDVTFWSLLPENLKVFNEKGLFSFEQLKESFLSGCEYYNCLLEREHGNVFKKPIDFITWYDLKILKNENSTAD